MPPAAFFPSSQKECPGQSLPIGCSLSHAGCRGGLSHVHFLSSCLPQSESTSEEAGEGEYVNLYSSGQSSRELAHCGGVSNLKAASCMWPGLEGLGPASAWLSLPVTSRLGPHSLAKNQHGLVGRGCDSWWRSSLCFRCVWHSSGLAR